MLDEASRCVAEAPMDGALLIHAAAIAACTLPKGIARKAASLPGGRLPAARSRRLRVKSPV
jgi:hypothetical protein